MIMVLVSPHPTTICWTILFEYLRLVVSRYLDAISDPGGHGAAISFGFMRWSLAVHVFAANKGHRQEHFRAHSDGHNYLLDHLSGCPSEILLNRVTELQEQCPF